MYVGGQDTKLKARLEKALVESAELRVRVKELESEKNILEATLKVKDTELGCAKREALYEAKTEMHDKVQDAYERGIAFAERNMKLFASVHRGPFCPPSSARNASHSRSWSGSGTGDQYSE